MVSPALSRSCSPCTARACTAVPELEAGCAETLASRLADSNSKEWMDDISRVLKQLSQGMAQQQWVRRIAAASHAEKRAVITQVLYSFWLILFLFHLELIAVDLLSAHCWLPGMISC